MVLDRFFEQIRIQFADGLPFVVYKKPNSFELKCLLQQTKERHTVVDFSESGFVFAPFDTREDVFIIPVHQADISSVPYNSQDFIEEKKSPLTSHINNPKESDKLAHIKRVEHGIEAIKNGDFSKVVLSRREEAKTSEIHPLEIFKRLLHRYPTAFVYCWYHPEVGLWLGATPETLLEVRGHQFKTMSLAGTQAFEGTTDVVWKAKEKEEQQIVTDFIVERLQASVGHHLTSDEWIKVSEQKTVRAGNLLHLQTEISMPLPAGNNYLKSIIEALHPTPAVCGFPKDRAKAYILEHEGYPREFYAGFMGELHLKATIKRNPNRRNVENNAYSLQKSVSNLFVNLRCMQIKDNKIYIYVGGGITIDSDPAAEFEETVHKSKIIKSVLYKTEKG